jgi:beta-glucosidase
MAVEQTRLGIPLLFGLDVIHGYRTIFPIPLAEACTWDMDIIEKTARLSALEGTAGGINWTFNPMVDISRDPRWGRIAEGSGEDPFLGSMVARAKVRGFQGNSLSEHNTMAACVKHFAAYGAPQAGRDYHTVDMSDRVLREVFLPPYKAAVEEGVASMMTSFNEIHGIPATGSKYLFRDILRDEWGYEGMVVTDYTSINEMIDHGYARDEKHAAELAIKAGIDMDMQGAVFYNHLKELVEEGTVSEENIDESVRNVLELKYDLGLFDDPYKYFDKEREKDVLFSDEIMAHSLESAKRSIVLLKNEEFKGKKLLPMKAGNKRIAVIGPLGDDQRNMLGTWHAAGDPSKVTTVVEGLRNRFPNATINYAKGADYSGDDRSGFNKAVSLANSSDIIILAVGENNAQSGEAGSRSMLDLPGVQPELVKQVVKTGKPVIALVMAGRPLTISWMAKNIPAIFYTWHLGTRAGDAIAEVISGDYNPSGKLVVTIPRNVGQIPIFYYEKNTGRPFEKDNRFTSKYLDVPNTPLYPFGYGLSYTSFEYSNITLNKNKINYKDTLVASVTIENTGSYKGEEVVQLYTRDLVGSVTIPVKELKGFRKIKLNENDIKTVEFKLTADDLRFYNADMDYKAEPGKFKLFIGSSSADVKETEFELIK